MYPVKSTYYCMQNVSSGELSKLYYLLWKTKVMPLALFLAWRVFHNRVVTRDNLIHRGVTLSSCM